MRKKRLLVSVACIVLGMGMLAGCAKEEDTVNQVASESPTSETSASETPEVSEEISTEASEEISAQVSEEAGTETETKAETSVETETPVTTETIDPDDIKLRNIFIEAFADTVILPAEPDMTFDEDVKMDLDQLTWVEMGTVSKNLGELTTEDMLSVGYIDAYGEEASIDERLEMIGAGAKGFSFDAYYEENIVDRIFVMESTSEEYSDKNAPEIPMKFTVFGIQVGEDAETLKQLGVPALVAQIDEDMTYYWQVETEDGGCCLCVTATDNIINWMEIMIF